MAENIVVSITNEVIKRVDNKLTESEMEIYFNCMQILAKDGGKGLPANFLVPTDQLTLAPLGSLVTKYATR